MFRGPLVVLRSLRGLRGGVFDVFGYAAHRREEWGLIEWYRGLIGQVMEGFTTDQLALALEIADLPDQIRGYEAIKTRNILKVKKLAEEKLEQAKACSTSPASA